MIQPGEILLLNQIYKTTLFIPISHNTFVSCSSGSLGLLATFFRGAVTDRARKMAKKEDEEDDKITRRKKMKIKWLRNRKRKCDHVQKEKE